MAAAVAITTPSPLQITTTEFNTTLLKTSLGVKTTIVSWLCFFIIIGFVGNCMLVLTVVQSRRLRTTPIHVVLCSMAIINLLDILFNSAIVLGAIASEKWSYGLLVCDLQAGLLLLTTINTVLHLSVLAADRLLAVVNSKRYLRRRTYIIMCVLVSYGWLHSTAFSLPLMSSKIPSRLNVNRYHCALQDDVSFGYVSFLLISYIVCILFIVSVGLVVVCHVIKLRLQDNQAVSYATTQGSPESKKQIKVSVLFGIMICLWGFLCAPYVFLTYSEQFLSMSNDWQMDICITWMRLSYPVFLPFVTFFCMKDAWQKLKSHLVCRKKNLVTGTATSSESTPVSTPVPSPKRNADIKVPVLFATENGLHYQTYDHQESYTEDISECDPNETQTTELGTTHKCDVYGSQDFLQMEDDTSDYSSVQDPFSTSNPISIKDQFETIDEAEGNADSTEHNGNVPNENKPADSGIDSTPGTKEKKKKKRRQMNKIEQEDVKESPFVNQRRFKDRNERFSEQDERQEPNIQKKDSSASDSNNTASEPIEQQHVEQPQKRRKKKNRVVDTAESKTETQTDCQDSVTNLQPSRLEPIEPKSERIELGQMGTINIISETDVGEDLPSGHTTPVKEKKRRRRHSRRENPESPRHESDIVRSDVEHVESVPKDTTADGLQYGEETDKSHKTDIDNVNVNTKAENSDAQYLKGQINPAVQISDENGLVLTEETPKVPKRRKRSSSPQANGSAHTAQDDRRFPRLRRNEQASVGGDERSPDADNVAVIC